MTVNAAERQRLAALRRYDILDTPNEREFEELAWLASHVAGTPIALVSLIDAERQWFKAARGIGMRETPREYSFCSHAIKRPDDLFIVEDASADARFRDNPYVTDDPNIRFYAGVPLVSPDGHALGTLCVIDTVPRSLTLDELRALGIIARQTMSQLELRHQHAQALAEVKTVTELARMKDDFVATVSHELRTPLTSIRGALQLLVADGGNRDEDERALLGVALGNSERLIRMINDILDIAKIEAGGLILQLSETSVEGVLDEAVGNVAELARSAGVAIEVIAEPGMPKLQLDRDRIVQAFVNLLSNALKFAPRGTLVSVHGLAQDATVEIAVTNHGESIPQAKIDQLFQKFSQLSSGRADQGKGTGLGLTITKALIEQHGGRVTVESDPVAGTRFCVTLPIKRP